MFRFGKFKYFPANTFGYGKDKEETAGMGQIKYRSENRMKGYYCSEMAKHKIKTLIYEYKYDLQEGKITIVITKNKQRITIQQNNLKKPCIFQE